MVASQTKGELPLTRPTMTALSWTNSWPNTTPHMATASAARSGLVTGPMKLLSLWRIAEAVMCRCRLGMATSTGSQITAPVFCRAGAM